MTLHAWLWGVTLELHYPLPHLSEPLQGSAPEVAQEVPRIAPLPGVRGLAVPPKHAPSRMMHKGISKHADGTAHITAQMPPLQNTWQRSAWSQ